MAVFTFELADPRMAAMRVVHMRRQAKELIELQRITAGDKLGDAGSFGGGALWDRMAHRAGFGVRQTCMSACAHVLMTELAVETEILSVFAVIERDGLGHSRAAPGNQWNHDRHEQ
jgi:hypothetical protein